MVPVCQKSQSARRGSMFLEAFIVIFLACVFLVVLIPHFLKARGVARRTQCLNNLRNVALALQNYNELHDAFPPGYVARDVGPDEPASKERGPGWGWGAMVLPYLEQTPVYQTFDFSLDVPGMTTVIQAFLCPDDATASFNVTSSQYGLMTLSPSNYVGVAGRGSLTDEPGQPALPGMFYRNSWVTLDHVPDGISNTLSLGERRFVMDSPQRGLLETNSTWVGAVSGVFRDAGHPRGERLEGPGSLVLGVVGQVRPDVIEMRPNGDPAGIGFSSVHPGGVHFSRVDGSCSMISDQIDTQLFMRLGQRADGEPASGP